jgi:leucyl aminopeptidase (aminopeptidase T)
MVVNNQTDGKKKIEELVAEIMSNNTNYLKEIRASQELSQEEKNEATLALTDIQLLLNDKDLDPNKMKEPVSILEKTSYVAAICSAGTDLYQLLN